MSKAEFNELDSDTKDSEYTLIRRDSAGQLKVVPYAEAYANELKQAAKLLRQAAELAEDPDFAQIFEPARRCLFK